MDAAVAQREALGRIGREAVVTIYLGAACAKIYWAGGLFYSLKASKKACFTAAKQKTRTRRVFQFQAAKSLFNLGFFPQASLVGPQTLLVQLLGDLGF